MTYVSPISEIATDPLTAREARGRELLRSLVSRSALDYRERRTTARTAQHVRLARTGGLSTAELQRVTGMGRQTLFDLYRDDRVIESDDPRLHALALLSARGPTVADQAANALELSVPGADDLLEGLRREGLVERSGAGYEPANFTWAYHLTPRGDRAVETELRGLQVRAAHPDSWIIFFAVSELEKASLLDAATALCGRNGADILEAYVSSAMSGPELGIFVSARDQRDAFLVAQRVYGDIRERAGLALETGVVAAFSSPHDHRR